MSMKFFDFCNSTIFIYLNDCSHWIWHAMINYRVYWYGHWILGQNLLRLYNTSDGSQINYANIINTWQYKEYARTSSHTSPTVERKNLNEKKRTFFISFWLIWLTNLIRPKRKITARWNSDTIRKQKNNENGNVTIIKMTDKNTATDSTAPA